MFIRLYRQGRPAVVLWGMVKLRHAGKLGLRIRIVLADDLVLGPGRADLLAGIAATGSIAASGRRLSMSYKRAWQLVEEMNRGFAAPLVEAVKGGAAGGGARLTPLGETVLAAYRSLETACAEAARPALAALRAALPEPPELDVPEMRNPVEKHER
jgi:molybdate transport system regulatory protein